MLNRHKWKIASWHFPCIWQWWVVPCRSSIAIHHSTELYQIFGPKITKKLLWLLSSRCLLDILLVASHDRFTLLSIGLLDSGYLQVHRGCPWWGAHLWPWLDQLDSLVASASLIRLLKITALSFVLACNVLLWTGFRLPPLGTHC